MQTLERQEIGHSKYSSGFLHTCWGWPQQFWLFQEKSYHTNFLNMFKIQKVGLLASATHVRIELSWTLQESSGDIQESPLWIQFTDKSQPSEPLVWECHWGAHVLSLQISSSWVDFEHNFHQIQHVPVGVCSVSQPGGGGTGGVVLYKNELVQCRSARVFKNSLIKMIAQEKICYIDFKLPHLNFKLSKDYHRRRCTSGSSSW